jgi:hypothetical protein avisC_02851
MGGDLRQSTKYIDWAPVPSRWIERRFLVFTALRSPGFFLLHLVLLPIMLLSVMFAGGIFSNAGVPVPMLLVLILLAWTAIFEFIMFRLVGFTVVNASGVHIFHFYLCWWRRTDVAWIDFREMACVLDFVAPTVWYGGYGAKGPDTLNLGLRLKTKDEWLQFVRERGKRGSSATQASDVLQKDWMERLREFDRQAEWRFDDKGTVVPGFARLARSMEGRQSAQERIAHDWRALIEWAEQNQYLPRRLYPFESFPGFLPW